MTMTADLRFRMEEQQRRLLEKAAEDAGVVPAVILRQLIDDNLGGRRRLETIRIPDEPTKALVRQVSSPAGKNDQGRRGVVETDDQVGVAPPPTGWEGRRVQVRRGVKASSRRCQCPPETALDGQVCTGCWNVR